MDFQPHLQISLDLIIKYRRQTHSDRSILVTLSGIDGSGKGYISGQLTENLNTLGFNTINLNGDGWLNLPQKRFNRHNPAEHFYKNALRLEDMFSQLVLPLKEKKSINLEADYGEETATSYSKHLYKFDNVEIIILEAIYLLQPQFINDYDCCFWIDCSFQTALNRAVVRQQESLSREETIWSFLTIYFPAQLLHFQQDNPKSLATGIINNDPLMKDITTYPQMEELDKQIRGINPEVAKRKNYVTSNW